MHFRLTAGQRHDSKEALLLIDGIYAKYFVGDKAYDSAEIRQAIEQRGGTAVVPSLANRKIQHHYDKEIYKRRNQIERFFCKIKEFRRIATRYEKLARRYAAMILLVSALVLV